MAKDRGKRGLTVTDAVFDGNKSGWQAVDYKVIVKKDVVEEKTSGGLFIPKEAREMEEWNVSTGVVISFGDLAFTQGRRDNGEMYHWNIRPKPGDRVMTKEFAGLKFVGDDDETYIMYADKDIAAVKVETA